MALPAQDALLIIQSIMAQLTPNNQDWVAEQLYKEYVGYLTLPDDEPDWKDQINARPSTTVLAPLEKIRVIDVETPLF